MCRAEREALDDLVRPPRCPWQALPEEVDAVVGYALSHPRAGYRRLAWMLVDEEVAYLSPSSVYRILDDADLLYRWKRSRGRRAAGRADPTKRAAESNGRIERFHRSTREALDAAELGNLSQARAIIDRWVTHDNETRLHAALHYLPPAEYYAGDPAARLAERCQKPQTARQRRRALNKARLQAAA